MAARYFNMLNSRVGMIQLRNIPANSLCLALRSDLLAGLVRARKERVEAVVIFGEGKGFSAGADINEFPRRRHLQQPMLGDVVRAIDNSEVPVIAGIHGYCFGGALELALACQYRLVDRTAKLAFPEVNIGLIPGAGGTQRLPRLVGSKLALDMCIFGEPLDSRACLESGLVDQILRHDMSTQISGKDSKVTANFAIEELAEYALKRAEEAQESGAEELLNSRRLSKMHIETTAAGSVSDDFWLDYHAKHVADNSSNKYKNGTKAPMAAFRCVQIACKAPSFDTGISMERRQFDELCQGVEARSLQYAFFGDKKAKRTLAAIQYIYKTNGDGECANGNGDGKHGGGLSGVSIDEVRKAKKLWGLCQGMLQRYAHEIAYLIDTGLAKPREVDEALTGFIGMPHKPTDIARAFNTLPSAVSEQEEEEGAGNMMIIDPFAKSLNKADIAARCLFPMINEGFRRLQDELHRDGDPHKATNTSSNTNMSTSLSLPDNDRDITSTSMISPDEVDALFRHAPLLATRGIAGAVFPRHRGGPMFFAESDVGLRDVLSTLKSLHDQDPSRQPSFEPSGLLVDTVQGSSTLREEIYFKSSG